MRVWLALLSFLMSFRVTPEKIVSYLEKACTNQRDNTAFITPEALRVAAVQLRVRGYKNLKDYLSEMLSLTQEAVDNGAQVVVFPEYVGLFAATLLPEFGRLLYWVMEGDTPDTLDEVRLRPRKIAMLAESFQNYIYEAYVYTFSTLARLLHVYIAAGSCIVYERGALYNRSVLFDPQGEPLGAQDKTAILGFDKAMGVKPCEHVEVFDTPMGKLSIVLGSDAYYFENFKAAVEMGARLILVPDGRGGVTADVLRCRAEESGVYTVYSCYANPKHKQVRAGVLAPFAMTAEHAGTVAQAGDSRASTVTVRINLEKLQGKELEANPEFLEGDYLHSYLYSGKFPMPAQNVGKLPLNPPDERKTTGEQRPGT